jgi:hypothetical protein
MKVVRKVGNLVEKKAGWMVEKMVEKLVERRVGRKAGLMVDSTAEWWAALKVEN